MCYGWTPFASFPFIGAAGNNFSTFFAAVFGGVCREPLQGCSDLVQTVSESAPFAVPLRSRRCIELRQQHRVALWI